jgi:hypothetical protein
MPCKEDCGDTAVGPRKEETDRFSQPGSQSGLQPGNRIECCAGRRSQRDVEAIVLLALDQPDDEMGKLGLEQQGSSGSSQLRAKRPGLIRQGAIVPGISTSDVAFCMQSRHQSQKTSFYHASQKTRP